MKVGIVGKLGSGKTSLADYMVEYRSFTKLSLADPMREICRKYFKIDKRSPQYRRIMQKLGTDWFRSEDEDVWINYLLETVARLEDDHSGIKIVVDDVRFPNEAKKLLENGFKLVYLYCPDEVRIARCKARDPIFEESSMNHPSELGVDEIVRLYSERLITFNAETEIRTLHYGVSRCLCG